MVLKENCKTTITNCGFKDTFKTILKIILKILNIDGLKIISETCKTIVTNGGSKGKL